MARAKKKVAEKPKRSSPQKPKPATVLVKKTPKPKRCIPCDGRPLRSQCCHTAIGRAYLQALAVQTSNATEEATETATSGSRCDHCPGRPLMLECKHTTAGRLYLARQQALQDIQLPSQTSPPVPSTPVRIPPLPLLHNASGGHLVFPSTPSSGSDFGTPRSDRTGATIDNPFLSSPLPSSSPGMSSPGTTTKEDFPFGKMKFYQGREAAGIARKQALPHERTNAKEAGRYFRDKMSTIFRKCENVAAASKCYIFVGAYRPGSQNGAWTWASPRLRNDGGVALPVADTLANSFNDGIKDLLEAQRLDFSKIKSQVTQERMQNDSLRMELSQQKDFNSQLMGQITSILNLVQEMSGVPTASGSTAST